MNITTVEHCAGCLACQAVCPKKCISTTHDAIGHVQPVVDSDICIDCSLCAKICPEITPLELSPMQQVYAAWDKNEEARKKSSSGGLATLISQQVIKEGGVVYGSAFQPPLNITHTRCDSIEALEKLRGSKYVQSDTGGCWKQLRADIKEGKKVLFIGTPCQVAAARRICKESEMLYTIDLICHGVPSMEMIKKSLPASIDYAQIANITFRDSTDFKIKILDNENKTIYTRPLHKDWYLKGFFTALFYRDSCYNCKYAKGDRIGDITLGDFWGVKESVINTDTDNGISAVCVNTDKGGRLVESIHTQANIVERDVAEVKKENKQLNHPSKKSIRTNLFKKLIRIFKFNTAVKLCLPEITIKSYITSIIKR